MKRIAFTLVYALGALVCHAQHATVDTLYYDANGKGGVHPAFAAYYRILPFGGDSCQRKPFRDYYPTGELRTEGGLLHIDSLDDSRTVFDGPWTDYYRSGRVAAQRLRLAGKNEGEHTSYYEDGLIRERAYYLAGKLTGIRTEFPDDGSRCIQTEYENGLPKYGYYTVSNPDGYVSRFRFEDDAPVFESPETSELDEAYRDGEKWKYYDKNGLTVSMTGQRFRDYGKYYRLEIQVANHSLLPADVDPTRITAVVVDKADSVAAARVFTHDEYRKRVRRRQNWNSVLYGFAVGLTEADAAYSGTSTAWNSCYGSSGPRTFQEQIAGTSRSASYDAAAAFQARMLANDAIAAFDEAQHEERAVKQRGYLKRTTLFPGDSVSGYVLVQRLSGKLLFVALPIDGAVYSFVWDIAKELPKQK